MGNTKILILFILLVYLLILFWRFQTVDPATNIEINLFQDIRLDLDKKISELLPPSQAALLSGIILGNKKDLPYNVKLWLRDTSTIHIVVVSGQNLTFVASFILSLAGLIKRRWAILISILAVILYTILTGAQVPVLRAALMFGFSSIAQFFGKERDGVWTLFLTGGLMLIVNPFWLGNLSFQLSFLATFGVIVVSPIILKLFKNLPEIIRQDLAISLAAQLMVTPIIAQNFNQFSVVGLFANLFVLWTIPIIMILGGAMILASILFIPIANILAILVGALLSYFLYIVQFFASLPFAWEYIPEISWLVWIGYYAIVAGVLKLAYDLGKRNQ